MIRITPALLILFGLLPGHATAEGIRARELGIPFEGVPGPLNAITDVSGIEIGYVTLVEGAGPLVKGEGPVRTGVTAILPRGRVFDPVFAATYALNGNGEMTGRTWIEESGFLETPIVITNTFSVGVARDAVISWMDRTGLNADPEQGWWYTYPLVAETYDALNDILGQHVTREHVLDALDRATGGAVAEGNVGGGTGMIAHGFKGGTGTASRLTGSGHTLGVLVQANYGSRRRFTVAGVPVGLEIPDLLPTWEDAIRGSIIVVVATDAPLLPHQLQRLVERVPIAIGRLGGLGSNGSGDIFIAFSTGNPGAWRGELGTELETVSNQDMNQFFEVTVGATEEAILNAMVAAETMIGRDGVTAHAIPHDRLQEALRRYGRWVDPTSLPRAAEVPMAELEKLTGSYRLVEDEVERTLYLENGVLFYDRGDSRSRVVPLVDGRLLLITPGYEWELEEIPEEDGPPSGLRWLRNGEVHSHLEPVEERGSDTDES